MMRTDFNNVRMQVKLLDARAKIPFKKRESDAGYDLICLSDHTLEPHAATLVPTGISLSAPQGYYYTIEGRSSLWSKGIAPNRGIIDTGYTGEIWVSLVNWNDSPYFIRGGDRIAQILLHKQYDAIFDIVGQFSPEYSHRGDHGFGSTGR